MNTLTREEQGKDARGNKYLTKVYQDFTPITPSGSASSYSLTYEDGVYTLTETYTEEVPDPGGGGGQTFPDIWSLDISTTTEPLESHPKFRAGMTASEMANWMAWKQGRESATDPKTSSNAVVQGLYERFNRGETDYLSPRIVLKLQKVYQVPPDLTGVGYKYNTINGNPFNFSTEVNFLAIGATAVTEGSRFRVTLEWLTSKPGGWDSYVYTP